MRRVEDWDVRAGGSGGEGRGLEADGGEAGGEVGANTIWVMLRARLSEGGICDAEGGRTIEGFTLFLTDAFVFADEEIELLIRARDRADLIA